ADRGSLALWDRFRFAGRFKALLAWHVWLAQQFACTPGAQRRLHVGALPRRWERAQRRSVAPGGQAKPAPHGHRAESSSTILGSGGFVGFAVIIGIDDYRSWPLTSAVNDAL